MFGFIKKKEPKEYNPLSPFGFPSSPHPLRGWTNFGMFEVHGMNPDTGRENKKIVEALTSSHAREQAASMGLAEPISVKEIQRPMATDRQIAYGESLGINITTDMSMIDASALICRVDDGETFRDRISKEDWFAACRAGVIISALSGPKNYESSMKGHR